MIRPNFRRPMIHSAKGSTWEDHKYIKRIDGTYYYPDSYQGGRHLPNGDKNNNSSDNDDVISKLEDLTGMTRESLLELRELSRKNGYDSSEFKEMLDILSEGDEDQAKKMMDILKQEDSGTSISSNDIENLALEVIRGNFGNGQTRKDLLNGDYQAIQNRVNELMKSMKISEASIGSISEKIVESGENAIKSAVKKVEKTVAEKGIDMNQVQSVYRKKNK